MAGPKIELKKLAKGSSGKKTKKKSGGKKKSGIEKTATKLSK